jgi:hypothetical protein
MPRRYAMPMPAAPDNGEPSEQDIELFARLARHYRLPNFGPGEKYGEPMAPSAAPAPMTAPSVSPIPSPGGQRIDGPEAVQRLLKYQTEHQCGPEEARRALGYSAGAPGMTPQPTAPTALPPLTKDEIAAKFEKRITTKDQMEEVLRYQALHPGCTPKEARQAMLSGLGEPVRYSNYGFPSGSPTLGTAGIGIGYAPRPEGHHTGTVQSAKEWLSDTHREHEQRLREQKEEKDRVWTLSRQTGVPISLCMVALEESRREGIGLDKALEFVMRRERNRREFGEGTGNPLSITTMR